MSQVDTFLANETGKKWRLRISFDGSYARTSIRLGRCCKKLVVASWGEASGVWSWYQDETIRDRWNTGAAFGSVT
jgi:hypothetical protein